MLGDAARRLQAILTELRRLPAVLGATIARRDGILIAHALPKNMDPKKIAAMAAAIVGTSEMAVIEMGLGSFNSSIVDTQIGKMIATGAGEEGPPAAQRRQGGPVDRRDPQGRGGARMTDVWVRLEETIDELSRVTDIKSAAVVRRDGLVVTHTLPEGVDPKMVAAMTAAIVGTSEMATIQLAQGRFVRAIIESDEGKLLSLGAGEEALLVALVYDDANLGLVLLAMERAAKQVEKILRGAGCGR